MLNSQAPKKDTKQIKTKETPTLKPTPQAKKEPPQAEEQKETHDPSTKSNKGESPLTEQKMPSQVIYLILILPDKILSGFSI